MQHSPNLRIVRERARERKTDIQMKIHCWNSICDCGMNTIRIFKFSLIAWNDGFLQNRIWSLICTRIRGASEDVKKYCSGAHHFDSMNRYVQARCSCIASHWSDALTRLRYSVLTATIDTIQWRKEFLSVQRSDKKYSSRSVKICATKYLPLSYN